jgi:hypothetical protein
MDADTLKVVATIFNAIVNSLTDAHRAEICDTIKRAADNSDQSDECREFYRIIHHTATADPAQLVIETERLQNGGRPRLTIVIGGDAA